MGTLEAVYRVRLSFPLIAHAVNQEPAVIKFADTNNSVSIEYPKHGPTPEKPELEGFDEIVLRIERECTATQAEIRTNLLNNFQMDPVPVYTRFALDATYFAERDPTRGIIMACAAWETALRNYLTDVAAKRDPAYCLAADSRSIALLRRFAETAKGSALLQDAIDQSTGVVKEHLEYDLRMLNELPKVRNKLLHQGEMEVSTTNARATASAVLTAIKWFFGTP